MHVIYECYLWMLAMNVIYGCYLCNNKSGNFNFISVVGIFLVSSFFTLSFTCKHYEYLPVKSLK